MYRIRPSEFLADDLVAFNFDMVMALKALEDMKGCIEGIETPGDDLGGGIAKAVAVGVIAGS